MKTILPLPILKGSLARLLFVVIFVLISSNTRAQKPATGKLIITFTDIRSDVGNIAAGVYDSEKQWTDNPRYSYTWDKKNLKNGRLVVEVKDLPYATYAISVLDDEDKSNSMKYLLNLPQEGWGMSTNPSFLKLKAPAFDVCKFELDTPTIQMEIEMNYLNKKKNVK